MQRAGVLLGAVLLAACSSSSTPHAAAPTTTVAPTTTTLAATTSTTKPDLAKVAAPQKFPLPTFVAMRKAITINRLDTGAVVQELVKPQSSGRRRYILRAMRTPNGDLLLFIARASHTGIAEHYWLNQKTGVRFVATQVAVSPDGKRAAAIDRNYPGIREFDLATGRVLHDVAIGKRNLDGFQWTPDSRSLVIAFRPNSLGPTDRGGIALVDRDANAVPDQPAFVGGPDKQGGAYAYAAPAVLPDGHVLAFRYPPPVQRYGWPSTLVDIDLRDGTEREIHAMTYGPTGPNIDVRDGWALILDGRGVWLYHDGSLRRVPGFATDAHW